MHRVYQRRIAGATVSPNSRWVLGAVYDDAPMSARGRLLLAAILALAAFGATVSSAAASPGAYKVLIVQADCEPPKELTSQIAAQPEVASVEEFNGCEATPTAAQLEENDLVVSISDDEYADQKAYGDALADYVDSGGVVVQFAYDNWIDEYEEEGTEVFESNGPTGRFSSGGYEPFIGGENLNELTTLGSFDASSPLMQGVTQLESQYNTEPSLAPGATLVAKWADGRDAIAYKGRVVSVSAYTGDEGGEPNEWSGDFGRLAVNAVRWLGRHDLTVANSNPAGGTVSGSGISCGGTCSAAFVFEAPASLTATPNPGFAFGGFSGACTGTACDLTMDSAKSVAASFEAFTLPKKPALNRKRGTGLLKVTVGSGGTLTLSGKLAKRQSKTVAAASAVKLPIVAKGKAAKALKKKGKAKLALEVIFTPTGGAAATQTKTVVLHKKL
jgi:hypothetical protein